MRRGCLAIGKVECDGCHRLLKYGERYLLTDEQGGDEQRLCIDCCQKRGYVICRTEKGTQVVSFFARS